MFKRVNPQLQSPYAKKLQLLFLLRNAARATMVFGYLASSGGNVLHARKNPIDILIALGAPTFFLVAFELMSRIPIDRERHWTFRWGRIGATLAIAAITGYLSYFHQRDALYARSGDQAQAYLLPVAVDALMVVGSISLIEVNLQIAKTEALIAGVTFKESKQITVKPEKPVNGRERFARTLAKFPELSHTPQGLRELASKAGISYNYAFTLLKELKGEMVEIVEATA